MFCLLNSYSYANFVTKITMDNSKLRSAISRIMSDLIKLDNLITASELDFLDKVYEKFGVTENDRKMGFYMPLGEAVDILSQQSHKYRQEFFALMQEGSKADGVCSRPEALLLLSFACACGLEDRAKGKVYSFEAKGIPLHHDQLIYVSREDRHDKSFLSDEDNYDDVNNIARLAGFELVYVPRIAKHFDTYGKTEILRKVLSLVRPTLDRGEDELIRQLRVMTPYKFYTTILERRMKIALSFDGPCWLIKLGDSQVAGEEYANFLLLEIDQKDMKRQLKAFMTEFLMMLPDQIISVTPVEEDPDIFRYGGFIKSILDMISLGTEDRWNIVIRLKNCKKFRNGDGREDRAAITIRRGDEEWPLIVPDRDAAFYVLILCATAEDPGGILMTKDMDENCRVQKQYGEIYRQMSPRDSRDCPIISFSETRRPIKSRIVKIMQEHPYLTEKALYQLTSSQKKMFVVLNPNNVFVLSDQGESGKPLRESSLYKVVSSL